MTLRNNMTDTQMGSTDTGGKKKHTVQIQEVIIQQDKEKKLMERR